jgi:CheY-like chemotaxis protein
MKSADAHHVDAGRSRVLVIDNDSSMVLWVRSVLQAEGYECFSALSGDEALATLRTTPDILVAISDIHMPGMDGISLLRNMGSALSSSASVPRFIFLTAYPEIDFAVAALRLGAVDFLVKPVRPQELCGAVRRACERVDRNRAALELTDQAAMLAKQAEALASALNAWKHPQPQAEPSARKPSNDFALLGLDHLRRPRQSFAPLGELDDVAWELLVELLRAERAAQRISVSALSISVEHISPTTALRRIRELVKAGHIIRNPDPMDARRDFVTLAPESRAALEQYLGQVAKELAAAAPRS